MSELELIETTPEPRTRASLSRDLRALGVSQGATVLVHASMRSLGWIAGGPVAVIQALQDVVEKSGTLLMPTHTGGNSDPANWSHPPVPASWHQVIRDEMPAFDPAMTPTLWMGQIAETFRSCPGVLRSNHPNVSFAAWGRHAEAMTQQHSLSKSLGEGSPLARVYERDGYVLLLGVGHDRNTSFHLSEYRAGASASGSFGAAVLDNGKRIWASFTDIDFDDEPFPEIGRAFEESSSVSIGRVGSAEARYFSQVTAIDFATNWLEKRISEKSADRS